MTWSVMPGSEASRGPEYVEVLESDCKRFRIAEARIRGGGYDLWDMDREDCFVSSYQTVEAAQHGAAIWKIVKPV